MQYMNVFQQCWANWTRTMPLHSTPAQGKHLWINELNQAIFARLEKILPAHVKVRTVTTPAFLYWTEAAGGYGVDSHNATVCSYRILLPKHGSFEERVDAGVKQLYDLVMKTDTYVPEVRTVFFYMPIIPICEHDLDGISPNQYMMSVRLRTTGETVDVEDLK